MKNINQIHKLFLFVVAFYLFLPQLKAQNLGCNYKPGDITFNLSGQTQGAQVNTFIVLIDGGNIIRYKSALNQKTLLNVGVGSYQAVAITYDITQNIIPLIEIGTNINLIGNCSKSIAVPISICDCNTNNNFINATLSVTGLNKQYVLTNGKGVIQQISSTANFQGLTDGVYNLYVVCNDVSSTLPSVVVGANILGVPSTNLCLSAPLSYVVCLPPSCKENVCIPYTVTKSKGNNTSTL